MATGHDASVFSAVLPGVLSNLVQVQPTLIVQMLAAHGGVDFTLFAVLASLADTSNVTDSETKHAAAAAAVGLQAGLILQRRLHEAQKLFEMCNPDKEGTISADEVAGELEAAGLSAHLAAAAVQSIQAGRGRGGAALSLSRVTFFEFLQFSPLFTSVHTALVAAPMRSTASPSRWRSHRIMHF